MRPYALHAPSRQRSILVGLRRRHRCCCIAGAPRVLEVFPCTVAQSHLARLHLESCVCAPLGILSASLLRSNGWSLVVLAFPGLHGLPLLVLSHTSVALAMFVGVVELVVVLLVLVLVAARAPSLLWSRHLVLRPGACFVEHTPRVLRDWCVVGSGLCGPLGGWFLLVPVAVQHGGVFR